MAQDQLQWFLQGTWLLQPLQFTSKDHELWILPLNVALLYNVWTLMMKSSQAIFHTSSKDMMLLHPSPAVYDTITMRIRVPAENRRFGNVSEDILLTPLLQLNCSIMPDLALLVLKIQIRASLTSLLPLPLSQISGLVFQLCDAHSQNLGTFLLWEGFPKGSDSSHSLLHGNKHVLLAVLLYSSEESLLQYCVAWRRDWVYQALVAGPLMQGNVCCYWRFPRKQSLPIKYCMVTIRNSRDMRN